MPTITRGNPLRGRRQQLHSTPSLAGYLEPISPPQLQRGFTSMFSLSSLGGILSSPAAESLAFKGDTKNGLARLYTEPVSPAENLFWSSVLCHFESAAHAFDTFSVRIARLIRDRQPGNFRTLVHLLTAHVEALKADECFAIDDDANEGILAKWVTTPLSPWTTPFGGAGSKEARPRNRTREALNCARLLTRLLPVLMEQQQQGVSVAGQTEPASPFTSSLEEEVLWSREPAPPPPVSKSTSDAGGEDSAEQFVIDDEEDTNASAASGVVDPLTKDENVEQQQQQKQDSSPKATEPLQPCLAERIIAVCIDLLFFPGFTLPMLPEDDDTGSVDESRVHFAIWQKGIGSSVDLPATTKTHIANRVEYLRLLLVLLSKSVYVPPQHQMHFRDRALEFVCSSLSRTVTLPFLCSLLNTACASFTPGAGWSGLSPFGGGGGASDMEDKTSLHALCLEILVVLLAWPGETIESASASTTAATPASPSLERNSFGYWLSKIHRAADLSLLSGALFQLLRPATNSFLTLPIASPGAPGGGSSSAISLHAPEAMTLLWRLLRSNAKFRTFVLDDSTRSVVLLGILLNHALLGKDSPALHGIVRLALFTLQDVSATSTFAEHIAKPGSASRCKLPSKFGALAYGSSSAADVLIAASYSLLTTRGMGSAGLGIQPAVLLALANCAPFFTSLSIPSSTRLNLLLAQFSNPTFLLANEDHPRSLFFLLETINAILTHQAASNHNVVYAILGKSVDISRLQAFTLRRGLADIRRKTGLAALTAAAPATPSGLGIDDSHRGSRTSLSFSSADEKARLASKDREEASRASVSTDTKQQQQQSAYADAEKQQAGANDDDDDVEEAEDELGPDGGPKVPSEKALGKARRTSIVAGEAAPPSAVTNSAAAAEGTSTKHDGEGRARTRSISAADSGRDALVDEWVNRLDDRELYEAASRVGKNGFVPTEEWVQSWVAG